MCAAVLQEAIQLGAEKRELHGQLQAAMQLADDLQAKLANEGERVEAAQAEAHARGQVIEDLQAKLRSAAPTLAATGCAPEAAGCAVRATVQGRPGRTPTLSWSKSLRSSLDLSLFSCCEYFWFVLVCNTRA